MSSIDLTTLANVKTWWQQANTTVSTQDDLIALEITRVSSMVLAHLDRSLLSQTFVDTYSGMGGYSMPLRVFPVTAVTNLVVSNQIIPAGPVNSPVPNAQNIQPYNAGFYFEPWDGVPPGRQQLLSIVGGSFWRGANNVTVTYTAGYLQQNEAATVPSSGAAQIWPQSPWGMAIQDASVTDATTGATLTPVASNPSTGQYVPIQPLLRNAPIQYYLFSSADAGRKVLLNYSYIPYSVEGAVAELVAERLSYRGRIGQRSKTLGAQETANYQLTDLPDWVKASLQPFRRIATVW